MQFSLTTDQNAIKNFMVTVLENNFVLNYWRKRTEEELLTAL